MNYLIETFATSRLWAQILAIFLIIGFGMQVSTVYISIFTSPEMALTLILPIFSQLMPGIFLLTYASLITKAQKSGDPVAEIEEACRYQARYFKYIGITSIISIIIAIIAIIVIFALGITVFEEFFH